MRLTTAELRRIILEEVTRAINEAEEESLEVPVRGTASANKDVSPAEYSADLGRRLASKLNNLTGSRDKDGVKLSSFKSHFKKMLEAEAQRGRSYHVSKISAEAVMKGFNEETEHKLSGDAKGAITAAVADFVESHPQAGRKPGRRGEDPEDKPRFGR
jgi:hypothetical protein